MTHAAVRTILKFHKIIVRDKVTRQCPRTTTFEKKEEPKRIQTEVPLLTSLTPYRSAKPAHGARIVNMVLNVHRNHKAY